MLTRLEIRNFQSLRKVDLDLGQFTVIVGPSSSGKSALIRACRALASNVRGSGVITRGQKRAAITGQSDLAQVTFERTETSSAYQLIQGGNEIVAFTKLAGQVPEPVTKALGIEPVPTGGVSVNFASQFDRPYLLDDSGATVARTLGDLTNVSQIFAAVTSANQIRKRAASTLKTRRSDLDEVKTSLVAFQGLGDRLSALERAEELHRQAQTVQVNIDALVRAKAKLRLAELTYQAAALLPVVPDRAPMLAAQRRLAALTEALARVTSTRFEAQAANRVVGHKATVAEAIRHQLNQALKQAGVCPTCGQSTI